ncbi:MAG: ATP-binding protein, partial [Kofleriaceae bacterium]
ISIGTVTALAPSPWLQRGALALMLAPAMVSTLLGYGLPVFAVIHAIFLAYTFVMSSMATREFWQAVASNEQLRQQEIELRHAQKLESVGRLAAGLAHEINTPVQFISDSCTFLADGLGELEAGIAGYRELVENIATGRVETDLALGHADQVEATHDLAYLRENLPAAAERAMVGLARVAEIVRATREFSRNATTKSPENLNAALESTLVICHHETGAVADVVTDLGTIPLVNCHGGELNQVFLNIIVNAAHAIGEVNQTGRERGTIAIRTWAPEDGWVKVSISDTGAGIPDEIIDKVFDPFFTTKPVGQGSGQGLAIARSIVVGKHGGKLEVQSKPGLGTTFTIALPA